LQRQEIYKTSGDADEQGADRRALKNLCLGYVTVQKTKEMNELAKAQFDQASPFNMNDAFAALSYLGDNDCQQRDSALDAFYQQWKDDPNVITKWFNVYARSTSADALQKLKELMKNPAFDITNPNLVRSIFWPLTGNFSVFHDASGAGHQFLADGILLLDGQNAHVAAGLCNLLTSWSDFTNPQQQSMKQQLQRILQKEDLSANVREIASKSLGAEAQLTVDKAAATIVIGTGSVPGTVFNPVVSTPTATAVPAASAETAPTYS
jgi:aminopeptidase N